MSLRTTIGDQRSRAGGGEIREDHLLLQESIVKNGSNLLSINSTMNSKGLCSFVVCVFYM